MQRKNRPLPPIPNALTQKINNEEAIPPPPNSLPPEIENEETIPPPPNSLPPEIENEEAIPPPPNTLPPEIENEEAIPPPPNTLPPEIENEEAIPPPPIYTPFVPTQELKRAQLRLKEFMKNSISLSKSMSEAIPDLNIKFEDTDTWPNEFLKLPEMRQNLWLQLLKKTIEKCSTIQKIENPFNEATPIIDKKVFTLEDYKTAIASIHSQSFDGMHNHGLKERAVNCIWFTLFYSTLMVNPINMENLRSLLITPFQRLTRLALYSKDGTADYNNLCAVPTIADNLPDDFKQIETQFQNLTARSLLVSKASNCFNTVIDKFISISKDWLNNNDFHLFLIALEPALVLHIEEVVSLVLNEEKNEKEVIDYIENTFSAFFLKHFNLQFSDELLNWTYDKINCAIVEAESERPYAANTLNNALKRIYEDDSLSTLTKASNMVDVTERTVNEIESYIKLNMKNPFVPKKSTIVDLLKPVIADISNVVNYLQPQPNCKLMSMQLAR